MYDDPVIFVIGLVALVVVIVMVIFIGADDS